MSERRTGGHAAAPVNALGDYLDALLCPPQEAAARTRFPADPSPERVRGPQESGPVTAPAAPERLQLLLLDLGALRLALPLAALAGIHRLPERPARVPDQRPWLLGLHEKEGVQVALVDTFSLVVPPTHRRRLRRPGEDGGRQVVTVAGGRWGLVCHDSGRVLEVAREAVRWRTERSRHPWVAGTLDSERCALLDVERFVAWLDEGAPGWVADRDEGGTADA